MADSTDFHDWLLTFRNSQGLEARGTLMHLTRQGVVFEVYNPWSIVQLSEVLQQLRIRRGSRLLYEGRAVVSSLVNTGLMLIVSATLVDTWTDLGAVPVGKGIRDELKRFVTDWDESTNAIRPAFHVSVNRCHNFLQELSRWLERGELDMAISNPAQVRELVAEADATIGPKLDELFLDFERTALEVPPELAPVHRRLAQRQLHPLMLCSPFIHRTFEKPLGYAGDYEMVNMILRDPMEGATAYAKLLNMRILAKDPAQAHRNRIDQLVKYLEGLPIDGSLGRPVRVFNVACGPAQEVLRFLEHNRDTPGLHLELLDFNEDTLASTKANIEKLQRQQLRPATVTYQHKSIHTLLKEASRGSEMPLPEGVLPYDVVYCAGLFDYLNDKVCERLVRLFCSWTRPGGMIITTNVHSRNPIKQFMDILLEWHLVYRDDAGMSRLCPPGMPHKVYDDATGVNVFLEINKP